MSFILDTFYVHNLIWYKLFYNADDNVYLYTILPSNLTITEYLNLTSHKLLLSLQN